MWRRRIGIAVAVEDVRTPTLAVTVRAVFMLELPVHEKRAGVMDRRDKSLRNAAHQEQCDVVHDGVQVGAQHERVEPGAGPEMTLLAQQRVGNEVAVENGAAEHRQRCAGQGQSPGDLQMPERFWEEGGSEGSEGGREKETGERVKGRGGRKVKKRTEKRVRGRGRKATRGEGEK